MTSNSVRPIRIVHSDNPADRLSESPTGSRSLSKLTLDFEEIKRTGPFSTELKSNGILRYGEPCLPGPGARRHA